ncbi:GNAT family N-acetyltransferase [Nocardioides sp. HDW12B]|uniref:GNAT family N-acetyltransferase n=1 Tax=Nocardioides sp. HDW12B TaxID=2714939 RepID=UPI00140DE348|nr:GNAT family protein [Nocardioides sp. HDW12B]QIK65172.1 GNAT family N-acetyltransferase [Nocardioides sp. HDW12B]
MRYRLVPLDLTSLEALAAGDLGAASARCGTDLTPFIAGETWLWRLRLGQLQESPQDLEWIARPAVALEGTDAGRVVGHLGFHAAPDAEGRVEVGYTIDPAHRRRGHARALLTETVDRLEGDPRVHLLRASISPDNAASLATIAGLGFRQVGEQWDAEDGVELLFERVV